MDISELFVPFVVLLIGAALAGSFFVAPQVKRRSIRIPVRITASLGMLLSFLFLALFTVGTYACEARSPSAYSPDGKHVAVLTWGLQGALGFDLADVRVRHRWSPIAKVAYFGPGDSENGGDPQVRWLDNQHLLIRYHDYGYGPGTGYEQSCVSHVLDIDVKCEKEQK
jgi:hypothetical protein